MTIFFVEGNIGTGKSTFLTLVKTHFPEFKVIFEPVDTWKSITDSEGKNMLQLFYSDTKRYAYMFQSLVLATRISKLKEAMSNTDSYVFVERSIWSDEYVFAKNALIEGTMSELEYKIYKEWFNLASDIISVDFCYIYLQCDPETSLKRIKTRNRPEESDIPLSYIKQIHARHESWLVGNTNTRAIINAEIDYTDETSFKALIQSILR